MATAKGRAETKGFIASLEEAAMLLLDGASLDAVKNAIQAMKGAYNAIKDARKEARKGGGHVPAKYDEAVTKFGESIKILEDAVDAVGSEEWEPILGLVLDAEKKWKEHAEKAKEGEAGADDTAKRAAKDVANTSAKEAKALLEKAQAALSKLTTHSWSHVQKVTEEAYKSAKAAAGGSFDLIDFLAERLQAKGNHKHTKELLMWARKKPEYALGIDVYTKENREAASVEAALAAESVDLPATVEQLAEGLPRMRLVQSDGVNAAPYADLDDLSKFAVIVAFAPKVFPPPECPDAHAVRKMMFMRTPDVARAAIRHGLQRRVDFHSQLRGLAALARTWASVEPDEAVEVARRAGLFAGAVDEPFLRENIDFGKAVLSGRIAYLIACLKTRMAISLTDAADRAMLVDAVLGMTENMRP